MPLFPVLRYSMCGVATLDDKRYPKAPEFTAGADAPEPLTMDVSVRA